VTEPVELPDRGDEAAGDPRVDEALRALELLSDLPVDQHPAVYEAVQDKLQDVLADLDGP
jgi:hypothetical protein